MFSEKEREKKVDAINSDERKFYLSRTYQLNHICSINTFLIYVESFCCLSVLMVTRDLPWSMLKTFTLYHSFWVMLVPENLLCIL